MILQNCKNVGFMIYIFCIVLQYTNNTNIINFGSIEKFHEHQFKIYSGVLGGDISVSGSSPGTTLGCVSTILGK